MKFLNPEDYLNFGEDSAKDSEFEEKIKEYDEYFSTKIKSRLPEKFIKEYFSNHGFHDWKLISIKADFFNGSNTVIVSLFDDFKNIKKSIIYYSVSTFKSNFNSEHFEYIENNDFGIDEFDIVDDNCFSHEVYFPSGASYAVHFSNIEILSQ